MFRHKKNTAAAATAKKGQAENPYVANRAAADDRWMSLAVAKHNADVRWRITAALLAVSLGFNGYYQLQSKFVPYVVAMDKIGNVIAVGPADRAHPFDDQRLLRHAVEQWVFDARTVYGDLRAEKDLYDYVYARVPQHSKVKQQLDDYYQARKPFETAATETIQVAITNVMPMPQTNNTWEVEWSETHLNLSGQVIGQENWKGMLTVTVSPLNTEDSITRNPMGFFVTDFQWAKTL